MRQPLAEQLPLTLDATIKPSASTTFAKVSTRKRVLGRGAGFCSCIFAEPDSPPPDLAAPSSSATRLALVVESGPTGSACNEASWSSSRSVYATAAMLALAKGKCACGKTKPLWSPALIRAHFCQQARDQAICCLDTWSELLQFETKVLPRMGATVIAVSAIEIGCAICLLVGTVAFEVAYVERQRRVGFWGGVLVLAALVYVGFVHRDGTRDESWLLVEWGGVLIFAMLATIAISINRGWAVALVWGLHPLWDILLHASAKDPSLVSLQMVGKQASHTPWFYPGACLLFDLAAAAWILAGPSIVASLPSAISSPPATGVRKAA